MAKTAAEWLALYEAAQENILTSGQSVGNNGRTYTMGDLKFIQSQIDRYTIAVGREANGGGIAIRQGVAVDV